MQYYHAFNYINRLEKHYTQHSLNACMVQFDLLPSPPGNPRDKSSPSGPKVGNCLKRSVTGEGGGGHKNILFSLILRRMCHFSRGLHDGYGPQDYVFLRKNAGICFRVTGEKKPINITSVFQVFFLISNECAYERTRMEFLFAKD